MIVAAGAADRQRHHAAGDDVERVAIPSADNVIASYPIAIVKDTKNREAAALFEAAMAVDGPQPAIRFALGNALLNGGAGAKAVGHLEAAFDAGFQPDVSGPLMVRALVLAGRGDEAARRLSRIPDFAASGPTAGDIALDLGTIALEHGAASEAIRWTRMAVAAHPDNAEAHEKLGLALFLTGDPQGAVQPLERACALDPRSASAHLNLAAVYAALGRFDDARQRG